MEQLFGAISGVLGELGPNVEVDEAVVFAAWKRCAGAMLAQRTAALEYYENRLVIAVEDAMWRRHLEELAPQMIARINGYVPKGRVKYIEFRVEPRRFSKPVKGQRAKDIGPASPGLPDSLVQAANNIADPGLRESFLSTAADYLERQNANL